MGREGIDPERVVGEGGAVSGKGELVASGLWRWLDGCGLERFELHHEADGWRLSGTILALHEGAPAEARYEVSCDPGWRTTRASVDIRRPGAERSLRLTVENGRWYRDRLEQPHVQGCLDVDLSWTPATNTLPIRRLVHCNVESGSVIWHHAACPPSQRWSSIARFVKPLSCAFARAAAGPTMRERRG